LLEALKGLDVGNDKKAQLIDKATRNIEYIIREEKNDKDNVGNLNMSHEASSSLGDSKIMDEQQIWFKKYRWWILAISVILLASVIAVVLSQSNEPALPEQCN
jgi:hypothetical protein